MQIRTVGIMSPGDMGHAIGAVLIQHGLCVVAALDGRSERTRQLAGKAGIEDLGSLERMAAETDLVLSVLVPAAATDAAEALAGVTRATGKELLVADCNAISPQRARAIDALIRGAGGRFIDASIIGGPPRGAGGTRIYASGEAAGELAQLRDFGLDVRVIGTEIGQASGLKMCYASLTKGLTALGTQLLIAAHRMQLDAPLWEELSSSQKELFAGLSRSLIGMPPKAHRWIGEMEEIAATFGALGLPSAMFEGVADLYRLVAATPPGRESPEERDRTRTLAELIAALS